MSNLIYYAHPRLLGSVNGWSGLDDPNGRSWLIEHAKSMSFDAICFNPLGQVTDITFDKNGHRVGGSLYGQKDYTHLEPEFSCTAAFNRASMNKTELDIIHAKDKEHLQHFAGLAKAAGMTVMADLVFNHTAQDHPLVLEENEAIARIRAHADTFRILRGEDGRTPIGIAWQDKTAPAAANDNKFYFKFERNDNLEVLNYSGGTGYDTAQVNYQSPAARAYFIDGVDGKEGYWKQVVNHFQDLGFGGFRCDIAYKVPAKWWSEIIQSAHDHKAGVVFVPELLSASPAATALKDAKIKLNGQERPAFDYALVTGHGWNLHAGGFTHHLHNMMEVAKFGAASCPDNHDTDTLAGDMMEIFKGNSRRDALVSDVCVRNYAVAALLGNSAYMRMGYEFCDEMRADVFRDVRYPGRLREIFAERGAPEHALNITERIKAINDFKSELHASNAVVDLQNIFHCGPDNRLIKMECVLRDCDSHEEVGALTVYLNEKPEWGGVTIRKADLGFDEKTVNRLQLGPNDATQKYRINDLAAFYTPIVPDERAVSAAPIVHYPHELKAA